MNNSLFFDPIEKRYWRCPVERCVPNLNGLQPYEATEVFSSEAPYYEISHDKQVRIWQNHDGVLAILLLYDVAIEMCSATWCSTPEGFKYVEVNIITHKETRQSFILAKDMNGYWELMSLYATNDYNDIPLIRMRKLTDGHNTLAALLLEENIDLNDYTIDGPEIIEVRITPQMITSLADNEVFVFGSNLQGQHAGGAAKLAHQKFGAVWGLGVGLAGQSYAIPTMHGGVDAIKPYVDQFIEFAKAMPNKYFYVTRIGCGIAGFKDEQIAPLFRGALELPNIALPKVFIDYLNLTRDR